jgi:FAD-dependent urate hydroxylase
VAEVVPMRLGQRLIRADATNGGVVIELAAANETEQMRVDHVIAGTGYRIDVDRLTFLSPELRNRLSRIPSAVGAPLLSRRFESSEQGLHFIGLTAANTFGPAMRFVCGTGFISPRLARHLSAPAKPTRPRLAATRRSA